MKLHHIAIRVSDIKKSIAFYRKLGFKKDIAFTNSSQTTTIQYVKKGDFYLELTSRGNSLKSYQPKFNVAEIKHFAFRVSHIQRYHKLMIKEELKPSEIKSKQVNEKVVIQYFFVTDPDGIIVEFVQYGSR